jgi:hypothetical protein
LGSQRIHEGDRRIRGSANRFFAFAAIFALPAPPIGAIYMVLASIEFAPSPFACLTATRKTIVNPSGYNLAVTETDCGTLAKSDRIKVLVSAWPEAPHDLIFEYDPSEPDSLPAIKIAPDGDLSISLATVGTVFVQNRNWRGHAIKFNIGREYDPLPEREPESLRP